MDRGRRGTGHKLFLIVTHDSCPRPPGYASPRGPRSRSFVRARLFSRIRPLQRLSRALIGRTCIRRLVFAGTACILFRTRVPRFPSAAIARRFVRRLSPVAHASFCPACSSRCQRLHYLLVPSRILSPLALNSRFHGLNILSPFLLAFFEPFLRALNSSYLFLPRRVPPFVLRRCIHCRPRRRISYTTGPGALR